jgi:hypothetical protein
MLQNHFFGDGGGLTAFHCAPRAFLGYCYRFWSLSKGRPDWCRGGNERSFPSLWKN